MRDDVLPKGEQGVVLGALGVEGRGAVARDALAVLGPVGDGVADLAVAGGGEGEDLLGWRGRSVVGEVVSVGFEGCVWKRRVGVLALGDEETGRDGRRAYRDARPACWSGRGPVGRRRGE